MYIVWKYKINWHLLQNRHKKTCQRLALYLFLKLVQINYIFSDNVCILYIYLIKFINDIRGHHGCDHMVAALTTTCAISAYLSCQFELLSWWDVLDTTLCDQVWENHHRSHLSEPMSWIFNDMINMGYDLFHPIGLLVVHKLV